MEDAEKKDWQDPQSDGPDVIIVGAGVAGAALAYTLGKVGAFSPMMFCIHIFFLKKKKLFFEDFW